jgi:putative transposase
VESCSNSGFGTRRQRFRSICGQSWRTFIRNHGDHVWACDFLQTYDVFFRPIFAFFIIEIGTRRVVVTPYKTPNANAHCERFIGSVRRECLDHIVIVTERQMLSVLSEYGRYHNCSRPHQGIEQRVPEPRGRPDSSRSRVMEIPMLGGLHHDSRIAA